MCALGISQLKRLTTFKDERESIFTKYLNRLGGIEGLILPSKRNYVDPMWHLFPIRVPAKHRERIFQELRDAGIGVQVNYIPAYAHPVFSEQGPLSDLYPEAEKFYSTEISLPLFIGLSAFDQNKVVDSTIQALSSISIS